VSEKQYVPEALRRQTRARAEGLCEYCLVSDEDAYLSYQVDHVIAEKHEGPTVLDNLAWCCTECNRYKGADLTSTDPATGRIVPLFNPRTQRWRRHFRLNSAVIEPLTARGRATVKLLRLNDELRVYERQGLLRLGRYPIG
jgi:5-methylcytosine-specific restriction endonuclease McrA